MHVSHRYRHTHTHTERWPASGGVHKYLCNKEYQAQDEAQDGRACQCHHPSENRTLLGLSRRRQRYTGRVCVWVWAWVCEWTGCCERILYYFVFAFCHFVHKSPAANWGCEQRTENARMLLRSCCSALLAGYVCVCAVWVTVWVRMCRHLEFFEIGVRYNKRIS